MKLWVPLVLGCCLVGSAVPAAAQFTAAVVPPPAKPKAEAPFPVAAHPDTVTPAQAAAAAKTLTNMQAWVDSAALALSQEPSTQQDTAARPAAAPAGKPAAGAKSDTSAGRTNVATGEVGRFRNGARAPATATPLPLLALLGVASLIAGALLRRRTS